MNAQLALALPSSAPSNTLVINARCTLRVEEHQRVIVVGGLPVHHYGSDDAVAAAYAIVVLPSRRRLRARSENLSARCAGTRCATRRQGWWGLGGEAGWRRGRRRRG